MSKRPRIAGEVLPFASNAAPQERTVFGQNTITDDINLQQTVEYLRGWGIVGPSEFPSLQDFSALGFTLSSLIAYLYEQGVPEYDPDQPYYVGGICSAGGVLFASKEDDNQGNDPLTDDGTYWDKYLRAADATADATAGKLVLRNTAGTFQVGTPSAAKHPVRKQELDEVVDRLTLVEDDVYEQRAASVTWNKDTDTYSGSPRATPVHEAMRRCLVLPDGTVNYYLDEFDSTKKENGNPAITNGADGQVMVEIPQCWVRTKIDGSLFTWELSHVALPGFELHPVFEGGAVEKVYIGAYQASVWQASSDSVIDGLNLDDNTSRVNLSNDRLYSTPGNFAMVGLTRDEFRRLARNGGYQLYDYWQWQLVQMLFITEYGNWNSQDVLGRGNVDRTYVTSSDSQSDSPHVKNGLSDNFGNYSGSVAVDDGEPFVTYRGIENPFGNAWQSVDGVNSNNRQLYVSTDESTFNDDIDTGEYTSLGAVLPLAESATYIKNWQALEDVFVPAVLDASADTFIGDALTTGAGGGWRVMLVGGGADGGSREGLSRCIVNHAASYRSRSFSSRLSKKLRN